MHLLPLEAPCILIGKTISSFQSDKIFNLLLVLNSLVERGSESRSSVVRPPSIHGTLTRHHVLATLKRPSSIVTPNAVVDDVNSGRDRDREPRRVFLEMKKNHNLGISLVGGNAVGIFIHAVQPDSPAYKVLMRYIVFYL